MKRFLLQTLSVTLALALTVNLSATAPAPTDGHPFYGRSLSAVTTSAIPGAALFVRPARLLHHLPFAAVFHRASTLDRHWMGAFSVWTGLSFTGLALWPLLRNADLLHLIAQDLWFAHRLALPIFEGSALGISALLIGAAARIGVLTLAGVIAKSQRPPTLEEKRVFEERYEVTLFSSGERKGGLISGYFDQDPRLYLHEGFAVSWGRWERLRTFALPALLGHAEMRWMGLERMYERGRRYPTYVPLYFYARALQQTMAWLALLLPANNSERGKTLQTTEGRETLAAVKRRAYDRLFRRMKVDEKERPELVERMALRSMPFKRSRTFYSQWRMLLWQQLWVVTAGLLALQIVHRPDLFMGVLLLHVIVSGVLAAFYAVFDFSRAVGDAHFFEYTVRLRSWILQFDTLVHQTVAHEGIHILKALRYLISDITTSSVDILTVYEELKQREFFQGKKYFDLYMPASPVSKASMFHRELVDPSISEGYTAMVQAVNAFVLNLPEELKEARQTLMALAQEKPKGDIGRGGENYSQSRRLGKMAIAIYDTSPLPPDETGGAAWLFIRQLSAGKSVLDAFDATLARFYGAGGQIQDPVVRAPKSSVKWRATIHFPWYQHYVLDAPLVASIVWLLHPIPVYLDPVQWITFTVAFLTALYVVQRRGALRRHPRLAFDIALACAGAVVLTNFFFRQPSDPVVVIAFIALAYSRAIYAAYRSHFMSGSNRIALPAYAA